MNPCLRQLQLMIERSEEWWGLQQLRLALCMDGCCVFARTNLFKSVLPNSSTAERTASLSIEFKLEQTTRRATSFCLTINAMEDHELLNSIEDRRYKEHLTYVAPGFAEQISPVRRCGNKGPAIRPPTFPRISQAGTCSKEGGYYGLK
jgi:hypothetical protein